MKLVKVAGATSELWQVFIQDSSSTTGAGLAGLVFNSSGLTAYYHRDTDTTATAITLVTMTVGTFTSSGFKEIDATNMPGWYQLCPPNAALASGAKSCAIHLKGGTNMAPLPIEVQLTAGFDLDTAAPAVNTTKIGGTSQTARDLGASVLLSSGTGTGQIKIASGYVAPDWGDVANKTTANALTGTTVATSQVVASVTGAVGSVTGAVGSVTGNVGGNVVGSVASVSARVTANADQLAGQTITAAAGVTFPTSVASPTNITAGTITTVTNLTNAPTAGDLTATMKTSVTTAATAATPIAASVSGAVGSVTGNVGGNVVGTVASVVGAVGSVTGNVGGNLAGNLLGTLSTTERNAVADALLDRSAAIETGLTPRQAWRLGAASDAGKLSGAATTSVIIRNAVADSKARITATVDSSGNRTAITTDVT